MTQESLHQWLDENDIPQSTLAALSGAHDCEVSRYIRGLKIPQHRADSIELVIAELRSVIDANAPVRLNLSDVSNARFAMEQWQDIRSMLNPATA